MQEAITGLKGLVVEWQIQTVCVGGNGVISFNQLGAGGGKTDVRTMSRREQDGIFSGIPTQEEGVPLVVFIILPCS